VHFIRGLIDWVRFCSLICAFNYHCCGLFIRIKFDIFVEKCSGFFNRCYCFVFEFCCRAFLYFQVSMFINTWVNLFQVFTLHKDKRTNYLQRLPTRDICSLSSTFRWHVPFICAFIVKLTFFIRKECA
jgi:hypothetical protein